MSSTPRTGVLRDPGPGHSAEVAVSRARMSGDALSSHQSRELPVTAAASWVREGSLPSRAAAHGVQPQFHRGKPPPAAVPSRTTLKTTPDVPHISGRPRRPSEGRPPRDVGVQAR
ncbi:hypothetical protein GCM10010254_70150 [Streptomyces chromofuscus]|nr:hypothetical protein GCM10010254_70150 [Streptomyces chromofuscus]